MDANSSRISEVNITPIKPTKGLVGFASVVLDKNIYLGSIGIYTRPEGGFRLTFPTKNNLQIFHPINKAMATALEEAIIPMFEELLLQGSRENVSFPCTNALDE